MADYDITQRVTDEERREFLKVLGVAGAAAVGKHSLDQVTLEDLRGAVDAEADGELAAMGRALRNDLAGSLDGSLLAAELGTVASSIERLPAVRERGFPERGEQLYGALTAPAWAVEEHLAETGFFESAEANLPRFTPEHIRTTVRQLVTHAGTLSAALSDVGFSGREGAALVANVVGRADHLALWEPAWFFEETDVEEVVPAYVPPLQRRAAGGALLWIDGLDRHLWQNEVLVTDRMLDDAVRDVRAMLGGFYLLGAAAEGVAREEISDGELTALVAGSTAIMISSQLDFTYDVVRITDDMRAPREGGVSHGQ